MADTRANERQNLVEQPIWDNLYGEDADGPYLIGCPTSRATTPTTHTSS